MSETAFNTMMSEVDDFSYEQCVMLLSRLTQVFRKKNNEVKENSPIDHFFGSVSGEDSDKMLEAVQECRKYMINDFYLSLGKFYVDKRCLTMLYLYSKFRRNLC